MPNTLTLWIIGGTVLLVLLLISETARKVMGLALLLAVAFAVGWVWPKKGAPIAITEAKSPPPCIGSL